MTLGTVEVMKKRRIERKRTGRRSSTCAPCVPGGKMTKDRNRESRRPRLINNRSGVVEKKSRLRSEKETKKRASKKRSSYGKRKREGEGGISSAEGRRKANCSNEGGKTQSGKKVDLVLGRGGGKKKKRGLRLSAALTVGEVKGGSRLSLSEMTNQGDIGPFPGGEKKGLTVILRKRGKKKGSSYCNCIREGNFHGGKKRNFFFSLEATIERGKICGGKSWTGGSRLLSRA